MLTDYKYFPCTIYPNSLYSSQHEYSLAYVPWRTSRIFGQLSARDLTKRPSQPPRPCFFRSIRSAFGWLLSPATTWNHSVAETPSVHAFSRFFTTRDTHFHTTVHAEKPVFHPFSPFFTQNIYFPGTTPPSGAFHPSRLPVHALSTINGRCPRFVHDTQPFFPKK